MKENLCDTQRLSWEAECVRRTRQGQLEGFGELYRAYAPHLYSQVLMPQLCNRAAAEDALSETFKSALERLESFKTHETSIYFWLMRIADNKAKDMHRARKVTGRKLIDARRMLEPLLPPPKDPEALFRLAQQTDKVERLVETCLQSINPRYKRAIELRFFGDHPREHCARELDVTLGTFDVLLLRALRAFRRTWEATLTADQEQTHVA